MTPAAARTRVERAGAAGVAAGGPGAGLLLALGFWTFCFFVFAFNCHLFDVVLPYLHLPRIAIVFAIGIAVLSGRLAGVLKQPIARLLGGLFLWLMVATVGSSWHGGSVRLLVTRWIPAMLVFLAGGTLVATVKQCRRALYVFGLGAAGGALVVAVWGGDVRERLVLAGSTFANANTLAIKLLLGIPMVWLLAVISRAGAFRRMVAAGAMILMLWGMIRTGSREGLIGLAVICLIAFVRSSAIGKLAMVIAVVLLGVGTALLLPQGLKARFATIFGNGPTEAGMTEDDRRLLTSAEGSSSARLEVLLTSLRLTVQHPFLGVGPGQFADYTAGEARSQGRRALWLGTHNTYTEISSEAGIPALCFYVLTLAACTRALKRIYKRAGRIPGKEAHDIASMALALHTSFIAYCVCCCFNHMAYETTMPIMAAITVAMSRTMPEELDRLETAAVGQPGFRGVSQAPPRSEREPKSARIRTT